MDYALQRRSLLASVNAGRTAVKAVCDEIVVMQPRKLRALAEGDV